MSNNNLPSKPTTRYRPKADKFVLSRLRQAAWKAAEEEWSKKHDALISSAATDRLELLFPVEDMRVLQKYKKAKAVTTIGIRLYNRRSDRWDVVYHVGLNRPVIVTDCAELSALRPQWWDEPLLGILPEAKEKMSKEKWDDIVATTEKSRVDQMPTELDAVFLDWLDLGYAYQQDLKIGDWISEKKATEGVYPTWGEIVAHCPILLRIEEFKKWAIAASSTVVD
jgi:hypothetical protein